MLQDKTFSYNLEEIKMENLINVLSFIKVNLNKDVAYCNLTNINEDDYTTNLYSSLIKAKTQKIENMVDLYNLNYTNNKLKLEQNKYHFDFPNKIFNLKLEVDNFNYDIPIKFKINLINGKDNIFSDYIIPYNYNGLYKEYLSKDKKESTFKVGDKNNVIFYNCEYTDKGFVIGKQLNLKYNTDYGFTKDGKISIDRERVTDELFIIYQPNANVYEVNLNKTVTDVLIEIEDNKLKIDKNLEKRVVLF